MRQSSDGVFYTTVGLLVHRKEALERPLQFRSVASQALGAHHNLERAVSYGMLAAVGVAQNDQSLGQRRFDAVAARLALEVGREDVVDAHFLLLCCGRALQLLADVMQVLQRIGSAAPRRVDTLQAAAVMKRSFSRTLTRTAAAGLLGGDHS